MKVGVTSQSLIFTSSIGKDYYISEHSSMVFIQRMTGSGDMNSGPTEHM